MKPQLLLSLLLLLVSQCTHQPPESSMARITLISSSQALSSLFILILIFIGQSNFARSKPIQKHVDLVKCHNISRTLVDVVTETLTQLQRDLSHEFNCTYDVVDVEDVTKQEINTITACFPAVTSTNPACNRLDTISFDEGTCLNTIHADLKAFKYELEDLNPSLGEVIKQMMQALTIYHEVEEDRKPSCSSFSCKMRQCGVMLSFRLRAITVSRMLNYLKLSKQGRSTDKAKKRQQGMKNL